MCVFTSRKKAIYESDHLLQRVALTRQGAHESARRAARLAEALPICAQLTQAAFENLDEL